MGRVKGSHLRRTAKQLVAQFPDVFTKDFTSNKKKLHEMGLHMQSKLEFNKLTGEIGVVIKHQKPKETPTQAAQTA